MSQLKQGYLYIILSTFLFSSMEITIKLISLQLNPIQISFLRFFIGGILLLPFALKKLKIKNIYLSKNDFIFFSIEGFIFIVVSMTFFQLSILNSKASIAAILFCCNPIFLIPLAYFLLKEKIYKHTVISLFSSTIGILCIINIFNLTNNLKGIIFCLLSTFTFALYSIIGKMRIEKYGGIVLSCFSFIIGSLELLVFIFITRFSVISNWLTVHNLKVFADIPILSGISLQNIPYLIYISMFITCLGYSFYFLSMDLTSASTASLVFFIKPALAPILSLIILKETIYPNILLGIILITIGSSITFISNTKIIKALNLYKKHFVKT